jgi:S1-C subfamily serine protease
MTNPNKKDNADLLKAIFPIVKQDIVSKKFQLFGTGFFIGDQGLFMTAKHVLRGFVEKDSDRNPINIFPLLQDSEFPLRSIKKVFWKSNSDVAVAFLDETKCKNDFLKLSSTPCRKGDLVYTYAFPASQIEQLGESPDILPSLDIFSGILEEAYPQGRDKRMLPNPCWKTNLPIHAGASGGPVFNQEGKVIGLTNSSLNIDPSCSFISTLEHIMNLKISDIHIPGFDKKIFSLKELPLIAGV